MAESRMGHSLPDRAIEERFRPILIAMTGKQIQFTSVRHDPVQQPVVATSAATTP